MVSTSGTLSSTGGWLLHASSDDDWQRLMRFSGSVLVDCHSRWAGPTKVAHSALKKCFFAMAADEKALKIASASAEDVSALAQFRGKARPAFLMFVDGELKETVVGCRIPQVLTMVSQHAPGSSQYDSEFRVIDDDAGHVGKSMVALRAPAEVTRVHQPRERRREPTPDPDPVDTVKETRPAIVVVLGAPLTGKTTLCRAAADEANSGSIVGLEAPVVEQAENGASAPNSGSPDGTANESPDDGSGDQNNTSNESPDGNDTNDNEAGKDGGDSSGNNQGEATASPRKDNNGAPGNANDAEDKAAGSTSTAVKRAASRMREVTVIQLHELAFEVVDAENKFIKAEEDAKKAAEEAALAASGSRGRRLGKHHNHQQQQPQQQQQQNAKKKNAPVIGPDGKKLSARQARREAKKKRRVPHKYLAECRKYIEESIDLPTEAAVYLVSHRLATCGGRVALLDDFPRNEEDADAFSESVGSVETCVVLESNALALKRRVKAIEKAAEEAMTPSQKEQREMQREAEREQLREQIREQQMQQEQDMRNNSVDESYGDEAGDGQRKPVTFEDDAANGGDSSQQQQQQQQGAGGENPDDSDPNAAGGEPAVNLEEVEAPGTAAADAVADVVASEFQGRIDTSKQSIATSTACLRAYIDSIGRAVAVVIGHEAPPAPAVVPTEYDDDQFEDDNNNGEGESEDKKAKSQDSEPELPVLVDDVAKAVCRRNGISVVVCQDAIIEECQVDKVLGRALDSARAKEAEEARLKAEAEEAERAKRRKKGKKGKGASRKGTPSKKKRMDPSSTSGPASAPGSPSVQAADGQQQQQPQVDENGNPIPMDATAGAGGGLGDGEGREIIGYAEDGTPIYEAQPKPVAPEDLPFVEPAPTSALLEAEALARYLRRLDAAFRDSASKSSLADNGSTANLSSVQDHRVHRIILVGYPRDPQQSAATDLLLGRPARTFFMERTREISLFNAFPKSPYAKYLKDGPEEDPSADQANDDDNNNNGNNDDPDGANEPIVPEATSEEKTWLSAFDAIAKEWDPLLRVLGAAGAVVRVPIDGARGDAEKALEEALAAERMCAPPDDAQGGKSAAPEEQGKQEEERPKEEEEEPKEEPKEEENKADAGEESYNDDGFEDEEKPKEEGKKEEEAPKEEETPKEEEAPKEEETPKEEVAAEESYNDDGFEVEGKEEEKARDDGESQAAKEEKMRENLKRLEEEEAASKAADSENKGDSDESQAAKEEKMRENLKRLEEEEAASKAADSENKGDGDESQAAKEEKMRENLKRLEEEEAASKAADSENKGDGDESQAAKEEKMRENLKRLEEEEAASKAADSENKGDGDESQAAKEEKMRENLKRLEEEAAAVASD